MEMDADDDADADVDVDDPNDNTGQDENNIEFTQFTHEYASIALEPIEKDEPSKAKDKAASSNVPKTQQPTQIDEEPLNLTINSWDKPLDLSIKSSK